MIDRDRIVDELRPSAVLAYFGHPARRAGAELRTRACPTCGRRSTDALTMNARTGAWLCHGHGCSGGILDAVAGYAGIDAARDFPAVLKEAATIAGVPLEGEDAAVVALRRVEREAQRQRQARIDDAEREAKQARAIAIATEIWERLDRRSRAGEAYLRARGVGELAGRDDVVRFGAIGSPAVALRTFAGEVCNVVARRFPELGDPKTPGLPGCPTAGTLVGKVGDVAGRELVVVVEGVIDALTAALAWPDAAVLGAHGAGRYAEIVEHVAPIVREQGAQLLLAIDADEVGLQVGAKAIAAARAAGLSVGRDLAILRAPAGAHDLNDAWRAGWRP